jgi:hypothetical protein
LHLITFAKVAAPTSGLPYLRQGQGDTSLLRFTAQRLLSDRTVVERSQRPQQSEGRGEQSKPPDYIYSFLTSPTCGKDTAIRRCSVSLRSAYSVTEGAVSFFTAAIRC